MQTLQQYIASQIIQGTRKHFGTLFADYQEITMSAVSNLNDDKKSGFTRQIGTPADGKTLSRDNAGSGINSGMTCTDHQVPNPSAKPVDFKNLKTGEDFRSGSADRTAFPAQPAPRSETGTKGA